MAKNRYCSRVRQQQAGHQADQGGFAGPVRTDQASYRPGSDRGRKLIERGWLAGVERVVQLVDRNGGGVHTSRFTVLVAEQFRAT